MSRYLDPFHFVSDFPHQDFTLTGDEVSRVIPFPPRGAHAKANAAQGAQLLEADRRETRMAELDVLIAGYERDRNQLNRQIATLREERFLWETQR